MLMYGRKPQRALQTLILALPETAGAALYGLVDVLMTTGKIWQALLRSEVGPLPFSVQIASIGRRTFRCGNGIPVSPSISLLDRPRADIVVIPELWLGPDQHLAGRYGRVTKWLRELYRNGTHIYSVCSASLLLAEAGLLDNREATSHWGYQQLFERQYPKVRFRPESALCFADTAGRLVTAGGATSWHDLVLHIISRHASPVEALQIAKVYLLHPHAEGQLPYRPLVRPLPHADSKVRDCEAWLTRHFRQASAVAGAVQYARIPERTLKRRFKSATGFSVIDYLQNLRIEEAKRLLESSNRAAEEISADVGYQDPSFFRRLFRRRTGLTPMRYRRMFQDAQAYTPEPARCGSRPT
jgi:transcriptional regulator GlxA family with amidase domain